MLVDPDFLLRVYRDPKPSAQPSALSPQPYRLSDLELASRLSFFLWSSIPDDELLTLAERAQVERSEGARAAGQAHARRSALERSARQRLRRAVAESPPRGRGRGRSGALSELRPHADGGVQAARPSCSSAARCARIAACSSSSTRTTRSSTRSSPGTTASQEFTAAASGAYRCRTRTGAAGCLAQGALLSTTSYPDRTSPVLRGKFLLNNIFGLQTPPPPPGVDTNLAPVKPGGAPPTIRERLAAASHQSDVRELPRRHRSAGVCARELRRHRRLAHRRRGRQAGRCGGHDDERRERLKGCVDCAPSCWSAASSFRAPLPKNCSRMRSGAGSSITTVLRFAASCATRRLRIFDGRRSYLGIVKSPAFQMRRLHVPHI